MAYDKTVWTNGSTALSAEHMNHIENGIKEAHDFMDQLIDSLYPVGSIYMSTSSANPNTRPLLSNTTWVAWGSGKVPVGVNTSDTDFKTVEKSGGAKTVTLTTAQMPSHTHTQNSHNHTQNAHKHTVPNHTHYAVNHGDVFPWREKFLIFEGGSFAKDIGTNIPGENTGNRMFPYVNTDNIDGNWRGIETVGANGPGSTNNATATNNPTTATNQNTGGGSAHNNLQPYITCYMWKRTG